jgi:hypothetical protein
MNAATDKPDCTRVLAFLAAENGAMLYWQVPADMAPAVRVALDCGAIALDESTDCLTHPDAVRIGDGYIMRPTPADVAVAFVAVLRTWLTPQEMAMVRERNRVEPDARVCHSHDFCDANMAMDAALEQLGATYESSDDGQPDWRTDLWNAAWNHACTTPGMLI